jgi:predicted enzyme related to lactoylglutathione lyase
LALDAAFDENRAMDIPIAPRGSGAHPVALTVISSRDLAKSRDFYERLFGWRMTPLSAEVCAAGTPAEQAVALRTNNPESFPGMVPFLFAPDVDKALAAAVAVGAVVEKPKWKVPMVGEMARFTAPGGTIYGFVNAKEMRPKEPLPVPLGPGRKAPPGTICSLELYAGDFAQTAKFFGLFGWGTLETMPSYMAFDTGAGVAGIFQSHTPTLPAVAYVACTDVGTKLNEIEKAGGKRMGEPMSMPEMGTFGYFEDPTGTPGGLIGPA